MKAIVVIPERRELRLVEQETPSLYGPRDVRVKMLDVGVCGTDREICRFEYGTPPPNGPHLVIGHEALGEVVEVGREVTRVRPGDLVVPMVRRPCAHDDCAACRAEHADFCFTGDFRERGIKEAHGFMTEQIVDDERYMNVVPDALRDVAVLVEPLTIAEKALGQIWEVQHRLPWSCAATPGTAHASCHRAVVIGAGPVGLLGAMALVHAGFQTTVYSRGSA
ncbi:MAG TPA: alcohol dehydrogenase catalytic domain-containing protein [Candidatus Binatia bacterium]|nr:alcohol dehydrogenase catalytic domain-containing protein [Candidatus Binatia bacterium]